MAHGLSGFERKAYMMRCTWTMSVSGGALFTILLVQSAGTQQQRAEKIGGDWPMYRHDLAGTGYSPLVEVNTRNVATLAQVWTYRLQGDAPVAAVPAGRGGPGGVNSEATPSVVSRVMYLPAANRVVALESETGKEIWRYPVSGAAPSRRGVAYWPGEGNNAPRIIFTSGRRLIALDARTGALAAAFGKEGEVDMTVPYNSVPLVYQNILVVGANTPPGALGGVGKPSCGNSVPCRSRERSATTPGRATAGKAGSASMPGRSISPSTSSADCSTFPWRRRYLELTEGTERARTSLATQ